MGVWIGLAVVVIAVVAFVVLRGRKSATPQPKLDERSEIDGPTFTAAPSSRRPAPALDSGVRPVVDLDGATAPAPELKMVSCTVGTGVHGAMPPFGRLRATDSGLVFEATSRVLAATNAGLASGDGASTMQSVGSIEMGQFRFDVAKSTVTGVTTEGARVSVQTSGETYTFEGLGPSARLLPAWMRDHGYS